MSALILGERSDVDEETKTNFANTGVIHVLAVSGLHVGYVSLILITIIGMFRLPYNYQTILVILGLGFYVILTGGAASVMRASIMASLMLLSTIIERKTDIYNTLATAAFIILMLDPSQLEGIGFQLSFSAVLSIVSLYPIFREWIPQARLISNSWIMEAIDRIVDLFLVSLAAQLGTLGLTMFYFNKIPIISLFANLLVVPIIGVIVSTGMTSLLIGSCIPMVAKLWGALIDTLVDFMLWFVGFCARFDWAYVTTRNLHLFELMLIIMAVFGVTGIAIKKIPKLWFILILLWGQYIVWTDLFTVKALEVIMLDVGQGDAIIVHTPDNNTIVIDAGLRFGGKDMGETVISPYLRDRNWNTIDLLVLTHPHNDHIGGAHFLIENHVVKKVMMQNVEYDSYSYHKLLRTLDSLRIPIQSVYTGIVDSTFNPIYLRVTGPKKFDLNNRPSNVNNISIVFQLLYGETSILFTGDAEHEVEKDQLPLGSLLQSDIIKAPHHGSKTSSSERYVNQVDPQLCLISLGTGNKFKHPAPVTMKRYEDKEVIIHRTDLEGAVIYTSDGKSWTHHDWRAIGH
jgi:competence protein ComEC